MPVVLLGALGLLVFSPLHWPCPLRAALGLPCPTCGMTRATRLLAAGDAAGATAMHPLVWLVGPLLAAYLVVEVGGYLRTGLWGTAGRVPYARAVLYGTVALLVIVWLARFLGAFGGPAPV